MKASNLDRVKRLIEQNLSCAERISQLKKIGESDMGEFKLDHKAINRIAIPRSIAKKLRASLIQQYNKTILDNRATIRLLGVDPDQ